MPRVITAPWADLPSVFTTGNRIFRRSTPEPHGFLRGREACYHIRAYRFKLLLEDVGIYAASRDEVDTRPSSNYTFKNPQRFQPL